MSWSEWEVVVFWKSSCFMLVWGEIGLASGVHHEEYQAEPCEGPPCSSSGFLMWYWIELSRPEVIKDLQESSAKIVVIRVIHDHHDSCACSSELKAYNIWLEAYWKRPSVENLYVNSSASHRMSRERWWKISGDLLSRWWANPTFCDLCKPSTRTPCTMQGWCV